MYKKEYMEITVRLYKLHDYDLIYLYKNLNFPVKQAMKKALLSYVRNNPCFFEVPVRIPTKENLALVKNAQFHIHLDSEEEADIILFLSGLKKNYRNSFLKNLLRGYLAGPASYVYENQIDINITNERMNGLKNSILGIESLPENIPKKRKAKVYLTKDQKELFDKTGALENVDVKLIN